VTRLCECGCGKPLPARSPRSRRFFDNAHRERTRKAKIRAQKRMENPAAGPSAPVDVPAVRNLGYERPTPPNGAMGRTRAGLEAWIARQELELPASLVEACRSLADEVDREPEASPLWGRYLDALRQLQEPAYVAAEWGKDLQRLHEVAAIMRADDEWRAAKYREAAERGDALAEAWDKLVPIGCVRDQHEWRRPDYWGVVRCRNCDTEREMSNALDNEQAEP
jgi:hypothetical protein